jgi:hypothetical protein
MHCYDAVLAKQHGGSTRKRRRIEYENTDNTRHENAVLSYYKYNSPSRSRGNSGVTAAKLDEREFNSLRNFLFSKSSRSVLGFIQSYI